MNGNKIILPITPQTSLRTTQKTAIIFRIPEKCYKGKFGCDEFVFTGKCKHVLSDAGKKWKRRVERYNKYKRDVLGYAMAVGLHFPMVGAGVMFYMPLQKGLSKKKRIERHLSWHQIRPDLDNLLKALIDSLMKDDKQIANYSHLGKKWVNAESGWIEITLPE